MCKAFFLYGNNETVFIPTASLVMFSEQKLALDGKLIILAIHLYSSGADLSSFAVSFCVPFHVAIFEAVEGKCCIYVAVEAPLCQNVCFCCIHHV